MRLQLDVRLAAENLPSGDDGGEECFRLEEAPRSVGRAVTKDGKIVAVTAKEANRGGGGEQGIHRRRVQHLFALSPNLEEDVDPFW